MIRTIAMLLVWAKTRTKIEAEVAERTEELNRQTTALAAIQGSHRQFKLQVTYDTPGIWQIDHCCVFRNASIPVAPL